jgi:hypothetical protein
MAPYLKAYRTQAKPGGPQMQKRPRNTPEPRTKVQKLDNTQWQAQAGLYLGLLALYSLGKMWPT